MADAGSDAGMPRKSHVHTFEIESRSAQRGTAKLHMGPPQNTFPARGAADDQGRAELQLAINSVMGEPALNTPSVSDAPSSRSMMDTQFGLIQTQQDRLEVEPGRTMVAPANADIYDTMQSNTQYIPTQADLNAGAQQAPSRTIDLTAGLIHLMGTKYLQLAYFVGLLIFVDSKFILSSQCQKAHEDRQLYKPDDLVYLLKTIHLCCFMLVLASDCMDYVSLHAHVAVVLQLFAGALYVYGVIVSWYTLGAMVYVDPVNGQVAPLGTCSGVELSVYFQWLALETIGFCVQALAICLMAFLNSLIPEKTEMSEEELLSKGEAESNRDSKVLAHIKLHSAEEGIMLIDESDQDQVQHFSKMLSDRLEECEKEIEIEILAQARAPTLRAALKTEATVSHLLYEMIKEERRRLQAE